MDRNNTGQVKWTSDSSNEIEKKDVGPKYSRFSESLRHVAPSTIQCSVFCGGRQCKYENPVKMKDEEMAIKGLYSSWYSMFTYSRLLLHLCSCTNCRGFSYERNCVLRPWESKTPK